MEKGNETELPTRMHMTFCTYFHENNAAKVGGSNASTDDRQMTNIACFNVNPCRWNGFHTIHLNLSKVITAAVVLDADTDIMMMVPAIIQGRDLFHSIATYATLPLYLYCIESIMMQYTDISISATLRLDNKNRFTAVLWLKCQNKAMMLNEMQQTMYTYIRICKTVWECLMYLENE